MKNTQFRTSLRRHIDNFFGFIRVVIPIFVLLIFYIIVTFGIAAYILGGGENIHIDFLNNMILITLSLFGFTLIGGIFKTTNTYNKLPDVILNLFKSSMFFLASSILYILVLASYFFEKTQGDSKILDFVEGGSILAGSLFFVCGLFLLIATLHRHLKNIEKKIG